MSERRPVGSDSVFGSLFEIWIALQLRGSGCSFDVIMPPSQQASFRQTLISNFAAIEQSLCVVDLEAADASVLADKEAIQAMVRDGMGFHEVNKGVLSALRGWLLTAGEGTLVSLQQAASMIKQSGGDTASQSEQCEAAADIQGEIHMVRIGISKLMDTLGRFDDSFPLHEACVDYASSHGTPVEHAERLSAIGRCYHDLARYADASASYTEAISILDGIGDQNPEEDQKTSLLRAHTSNLLAFLRQHASDYKAAESLSLHVLAICDKEFADSPHELTCEALNNLGNSLRSQNKLHEARGYYERSCEIREQLYGPKHPSVALGLNNLANLIMLEGKPADALPVHQKVFLMRSSILGPTHCQCATTKKNIGLCLQRLARHSEAEAQLKEALSIRLQAFGGAHPKTAESYANLGDLLVIQQRAAEALPLYRPRGGAYLRTP